MDHPSYKVSIVMPVYNVEKYLRQCLDSVVAQTLSDIEVIVVNDGSPDHSLQILEEYQSKHPQLIKVFSIENHGVSYARNYGLARASGEYILFVDSDDYIEHDMCEKLYQKAVKDHNDLVICGRYNEYINEKTGKVKRDRIPTGLLNRDFVLSENKFELAHIFPFPWDKLFKRELLTGMAFPENMRFEDLVFAYEVVVKAKHIGVVEEPLYHYRKTSQGGFLNSFSEQTLDIIKAFDLLFAYMEENHYMDQYHDELEFICARHFLYRYMTIFKRENKGKLKLKLEIINKTQDFLDNRLPNWRSNHYLKYSSDWLRKWLKLFTNRSKMLRLAKIREYMPNKLYKLITKLRKGKNALQNKWKKFRGSKNKLNVIKKKLPFLSLFKFKESMYYTKCLRQRLHPNVILLESKHGEDLAGNIFTLIKELSGEAYQDYRILLPMVAKYMTKYGKVLERYGIRNVTMIEIHSKAYAKALATAKYLITDTSFPTYYIKREEQVYLNTWHGTPLKAMGRIVPAREYGLGNVQRNFLIADYLLYQNDFSKEVFLRDYMIKDIYPGTILLSGYPRNSIFFHKDRYDQIRKECKLEGKQVILYMPTWRGLLHKKETDKQLRQLSGYFEEIDRKLTDSQVFYVKLHPYVKDQMDYKGYKHIKDFPQEYETYDFMNASDVLVTDYSSVMFDYGVTKRKMILFTYDREEYLKDRGIYLDLNKLGLPLADTVEELIQELNKDAFDYPEFYERFCSYDSKDTPRKVCEILLSGKQAPDLRTEKIISNGKKKILIFISGLKKDDNSRKLIAMINSVDSEKYDVFVAVKAEAVKKSTELLSLLRPEISYFPLNYDVNYTKKDFIWCKLLLKLGLNTKSAQARINRVMSREKQKYFGSLEYDYVIHHSGPDRMLGAMCSMLGKKVIYNFQGFDYAKYQRNKGYRKQMQYFIKRFSNYDLIIATKDWKALKLKADNVVVNDKASFSIDHVVSEVERHR